MATRTSSRTRTRPQAEPGTFTAPRPHEGLRRCPQCHGLVIAGKTPGTWLTPVRGDVHDCAKWAALLAALDTGGEYAG